MKLPVISTSSSTNTSLTVTDQLFGVEFNPALFAQAIRVYQARLRQGTSKVKTRSEINRTHKKWYKQKGTGNARHGARTPSVFVGGGVAHGPNGLQNWNLDLSQQMKHSALMMALTAQAKNSAILAEVAPQTAAKALRQLLTKHTEDKKTLVILAETQLDLIRKIQNMANIMVVTAAKVTVLEVAMVERIIFGANAVEKLEARLLTKVKAKSRTKPSAVAAKVTPIKVAAVKAASVKKVAPAKKATRKASSKASK